MRDLEIDFSGMIALPFTTGKWEQSKTMSNFFYENYKPIFVVCIFRKNNTINENTNFMKKCAILTWILPKINILQI